MSGGSSPRGRGKPRSSGPFHDGSRLIPAWAGKTPEPPPPVHMVTAHPRVGGENRVRGHGPQDRRGSSPRGRGKLG